VTKPDWQLIFGLDTDRHRLGRSFFIRGMGVIYLVAIASWWSQVSLLVGENGLAPASRLVEWVAGQSTGAGRSAFWSLPGLFWLTGTSDFALHLLAFAGCLLSLSVIFGRLVGPSLAGLWLIYLTFVNSGGVFMSFQWDILLLEAGFLSLFLCRWEWKTAWLNPPPLTSVNRVALVWSWLLIAKLMFFSGWVKLAWNSPETPEWWSAATAMTYHYMTQPLPTWTAWWAHQLPVWFHKATLFPMYAIEILLPFAVIFGRRGRLAAFAGFVVLMLLILLTGNYTYFNWLAIVLCLPLVHDRLWPEWLRRLLEFEPLGLTPPVPRPSLILRLSLVAPILAFLGLLNLRVVLRDLHRAPHPFLVVNLVPGWLDHLGEKVEPLRLASGYGLFRTMTTQRPEIIVEGSADGTEWFAYDFAWKVDGISDRPRFIAPHQPRVAWQFWFAALEGRFDYRSANAAWIESLVLKLLAGDRSVNALLKDDPFPENPPRFIRARLMRYEFTTIAERRENGDWWKRVVIGEYLPAVSRSAP
jgi:lipase maturation factor 1